MAYLFIFAGIVGMAAGIYNMVNPGNIPLDDRKKGFKMFLVSLGILLLGLWMRR